jgi:class 3 adenylate cyclase
VKSSLVLHFISYLSDLSNFQYFLPNFKAVIMIIERDKRKLSAVLSADVKGYSRLMGADESGTVRTLKEYREIVAELIQRYRGRVVDSPGDNLLAEFDSVVDAVDGAVEVQKTLKV